MNQNHESNGYLSEKYNPAERLLRAAEPDSPEYLLIDQLERSRYDDYKAAIQQRFYAILRDTVDEAMRSAEMRSFSEERRPVGYLVHNYYLPSARLFYDSMEKHYDALQAGLPSGTWDCRPQFLTTKYKKSGDYDLVLAARFDLKPVEFPTDPWLLERSFRDYFEGRAVGCSIITSPEQRLEAIRALQENELRQQLDDSERAPYENPLAYLEQCYAELVGQESYIDVLWSQARRSRISASLLYDYD